jgi:hypothetical protein
MKNPSNILAWPVGTGGRWYDVVDQRMCIDLNEVTKALPDLIPKGRSFCLIYSMARIVAFPGRLVSMLHVVLLKEQSR